MLFYKIFYAETLRVNQLREQVKIKRSFSNLNKSKLPPKMQKKVACFVKQNAFPQTFRPKTFIGACFG